MTALAARPERPPPLRHQRGRWGGSGGGGAPPGTTPTALAARPERPPPLRHQRGRWGGGAPPGTTQSRRGFTLIEVLLASVLTAMIGVAVAQVLFVAQRAQERVRERGLRRAVEAAIARRLRDDLWALVPPGGLHASGLTGQSAERSGSGEELVAAQLAASAREVEGEELPPPVDARDQLVLAVLLPPAVHGELLETGEGSIAQVTWRIDDDPDTEEVGLVRDAPPVRDLVAGAELPPPVVLCREAVGLDVRYYDGQAWVETWDSASSETLPRLVEVRLALVVDEQVETVRIEVSPPAALVGQVVEATQ